MNKDRLHPQTMQDLAQMVRLHGADQIIAAVREIAARPAPKMTVDLPFSPKALLERNIKVCDNE